MKKYYALAQEGETAEITIYGDITSWPWMESDVSAYLLSRQIEGLEAGSINVYINSYGGEVSEGLAIYTALKRHKAKIHTFCDGFACSAASVVFMGGDERTMGEASLLMIHNAWSFAQGNAKELRKAADDLEVISQAAANTYRSAVNLSDEALAALLDNETWISPEDAVEMGFATEIERYGERQVPAASARQSVVRLLTRGGPPCAVDAEALAAAVANSLQALLRERTPEQSKPEKFMEALMRRGGAV